MKEKVVALVKGDGVGPETIEETVKIVREAAKKDNMNIIFQETPMGWNAYKKYGDTLPPESFKNAVEIGTILFGGVGNPEFDKTIGVEKLEMKPEGRCLLSLRKTMGLLANIRPMFYHKELAHLSKVREEFIPKNGIKQIWFRYLLEDSYFGNEDLMKFFSEEVCKKLGIKLKKDVRGDEEIITDIAYFNKVTFEKYIRAAFAYAKSQGLPLISVDKANVMSRYEFWRKNVIRIGKAEFPDVPLTNQYVDSANALLFTPAKLHGVIACGNEHGDILSDGAAEAAGGIGIMCSSSINLDDGKALFESGAGTAPTLAGLNIVNPIGRISAGSMMLQHIGCVNGSKAIDDAVKKVLVLGYRTKDLATRKTPKEKILGTREMSQRIYFLL